MRFAVSKSREIYRFLLLLHGIPHSVHACGCVCLLIPLVHNRENMKRKRSPSPYSGPWPLNQEKKQKIELPLLFAGKMISDDLLCRIVHFLTVPEHARVTACDKRLNKLGKSERSWARNSTFKVNQMFGEGHFRDPQKPWTLGCRSLTDIDLSHMSARICRQFLGFYRLTLKKANIGGLMPPNIWECKQLTHLETSVQLSAKQTNKYLLCLPLTSLVCEIDDRCLDRLGTLRTENLTEASFETYMINKAASPIAMPAFPRLKRLELNFESYRGSPDPQVPIIHDAPVLERLVCFMNCGRFPDTLQVRPPCVFTKEIGSRLVQLHLGIFSTEKPPWETVTSGLLSMPVLEHLETSLVPPADLATPRLRVARIGALGCDIWKCNTDTLHVPTCDHDFFHRNADEDLLRTKLRWPKYACVVFYAPARCVDCSLHAKRYNGICLCEQWCSCPL